MHNGLFQDLRTVIEFYDSFLTGSQHNINSETGLLWKEALLSPASTPELIGLQLLKSISNAVGVSRSSQSPYHPLLPHEVPLSGCF